jgi:hypothetical protein
VGDGMARRPPRWTLLLGLPAVLLLSGCAGVGATLAGVGAGVGASHQLGGIKYKTFTEPLPTVDKATMVALKRMAIKIGSIEKTTNGKIIKAKASDRNIEIELESLTRNTTRMRSVARTNGGIIVDSATGVEIIIQTEKALANRRA